MLKPAMCSRSSRRPSCDCRGVVSVHSGSLRVGLFYYRFVHWQGAILSDAVLYDAQLAGADLRKCRLERASLDGADLTGATLLGATLGVRPMLKGHTGGITCLSFSADGDVIAYVYSRVAPAPRTVARKAIVRSWLAMDTPSRLQVSA